MYLFKYMKNIGKSFIFILIYIYFILLIFYIIFLFLFNDNMYYCFFFFINWISQQIWCLFVINLLCRFSHFYAYWQQIVNHDSCPHSHVAFTLQFVREIRIDVSLPLSLCIVVTCLPQACMCVCVRKTETEVLSVGSSTYELETKTGRWGGGRGGFGLSTIRSGMQWRPLNCALNPYDGAIDVVTWWRCGTCLDYITMYVCPKRGRREGSERRADSRRCCWL